jgi:predicted nucleic acid-binding protein
MIPEPLQMDGPALFDTAVWSWVRDKRFPHLTDWFNSVAAEGLVLISDPIALELLRTMPNYERTSAFASELEVFERLPVSPITFSKARDVQMALAKINSHRAVPPIDIVHAVTAINSNVPLIHYDKDFDLLAEVAGLDARWFVAAGSLAD